jgi:hypothetical protein
MSHAEVEVPANLVLALFAAQRKLSRLNQEGAQAGPAPAPARGQPPNPRGFTHPPKLAASCAEPRQRGSVLQGQNLALISAFRILME